MFQFQTLYFASSKSHYVQAPLDGTFTFLICASYKNHQQRCVQEGTSVSTSSLLRRFQISVSFPMAQHCGSGAKQSQSMSSAY